MTPTSVTFHEINSAFVLACRLLRKGHAGGKKLITALNLNKPIIKKAWTKPTRPIAQNIKNLGEVYIKKAALEAKIYLKNTGSITVDPLADIGKQNIEIAVSVDGSWGSRDWTAQNGIVDMCFEETGKVLDVTIKSAPSRQCSKMKGKKSGDISYIDFLEWYTKHESECLKSHGGSSGVSKYNN